MARPFQRGRIRSMRTFAAQIRAPADEGFADVLTPDALDFLTRLHREVEPVRTSLLEKRAEVADRLRSGGKIDFLTETPGTPRSARRVSGRAQELRGRQVA